MRRRALVFLSLLLATAATSLAQQGTSDIGGKVVDPSGAVLPGVAIMVTNEETGVFREVVTTSNGSYFVSQMVPGHYRLTAKLEGFKSLDRRGVVLEVGKTLTLDLLLDTGAAAETVTVTAASPLIDLASAEIGGHISSQELAELPAGNRSYMLGSLVLISPEMKYLRRSGSTS